ncbi:unnamed protein product [Cyclocybe aegerita]|uniref:Uncharacterized protein n=1 Tax=Cyclocybe aegerita TaxID=1973307 RepID=A0A8S0VRC8_CYCAE|nr:unnamed protein product [Cyclocybe aegerita]
MWSNTRVSRLFRWTARVRPNVRLSFERPSRRLLQTHAFKLLMSSVVFGGIYPRVEQEDIAGTKAHERILFKLFFVDQHGVETHAASTLVPYQSNYELIIHSARLSLDKHNLDLRGGQWERHIATKCVVPGDPSTVWPKITSQEWPLITPSDAIGIFVSRRSPETQKHASKGVWTAVSAPARTVKLISVTMEGGDHGVLVALPATYEDLLAVVSKEYEFEGDPKEVLRFSTYMPDPSGGGSWVVLTKSAFNTLLDVHPTEMLYLFVRFL